MGNSKSSVHCNTLSTMSAIEPGRLASVRREPEQWIKEERVLQCLFTPRVLLH